MVNDVFFLIGRLEITFFVSAQRYYHVGLIIVGPASHRTYLSDANGLVGWLNDRLGMWINGFTSRENIGRLK